jgi:hypothetical protein
MIQSGFLLCKIRGPQVNTLLSLGAPGFSTCGMSGEGESCTLEWVLSQKLELEVTHMAQQSWSPTALWSRDILQMPKALPAIAQMDKDRTWTSTIQPSCSSANEPTPYSHPAHFLTMLHRITHAAWSHRAFEKAHNAGQWFQPMHWRQSTLQIWRTTVKNALPKSLCQNSTLGSQRDERSSLLCVANAMSEHAHPSGYAAVTEEAKERQSL